MRRFTPGFVVRNGGLLLPEEAGVEVYGSVETSPEIGGGGGVGASSPAISAIARVTGRPAGVVWFRGRSGTVLRRESSVVALWAGTVSGLSHRCWPG